MKKNAMILAAGYGTRLKPITEKIPKALVEIDGVPVLEMIIKSLKSHDFNKIIINVHHFSEQIINFLGSKNNFGVDIVISDESGCLLDTGGAIKNAASLFDKGQPVLIHNVDVITNIDLSRLYDFHVHSNALATLAVKSRNTSRSLLIDRNSRICGWHHNETGEEKIAVKRDYLKDTAFSGIQVVDPTIFDLITETGSFSITDVYLRLAKDHHIISYNHDDTYWLDIGRKESLKEASEVLKKVNI